tara:strand:- start:886 stop:1080 length:195 start_codon:yes stop_codon:yes gene_type:complete
MKIKEEIQIELTPEEAQKIIIEHFSNKYDIESVYFKVGSVYNDDGLGGHPNYEVTLVKCVGKNK